MSIIDVAIAGFLLGIIVLCTAQFLEGSGQTIGIDRAKLTASNLATAQLDEDRVFWSQQPAANFTTAGTNASYVLADGMGTCATTTGNVSAPTAPSCASSGNSLLPTVTPLVVGDVSFTITQTALWCSANSSNGMVGNSAAGTGQAPQLWIAVKVTWNNTALASLGSVMETGTLSTPSGAGQSPTSPLCNSYL